MKEKLAAMPVTFAIMLTWLAVWLLALSNNQVASALCGNGIALMGYEYYRFLTAILVHVNIVHLLVNAAAVFWIGYLYERRIGSLKFLAVGAICAVLAEIVFLCIFRHAEGNIGGSVLNYALCGFALTLQRLIPDFPEMKFGTWSGNWLIIYLIAANIPLLPFVSITTLVIHTIAFIFGVVAALTCCLSGMRK